MTSHRDYVKDQDEQQLHHLIEVANQRIKAIKESGFTTVWTVSEGWANHGWFAESDYEQACAFAIDYAENQFKKGRGIEDLSIRKENIRPQEALELIKNTKRVIERRNKACAEASP